MLNVLCVWLIVLWLTDCLIDCWMILVLKDTTPCRNSSTIRSLQLANSESEWRIQQLANSDRSRRTSARGLTGVVQLRQWIVGHVVGYRQCAEITISPPQLMHTYVKLKALVEL